MLIHNSLCTQPFKHNLGAYLESFFLKSVIKNVDNIFHQNTSRTRNLCPSHGSTLRAVAGGFNIKNKIEKSDLSVVAGYCVLFNKCPNHRERALFAVIATRLLF